MGVPRLIVAVWGPPKSGKTYFAMSFPEPIAAIEIGETGIEDYAAVINPTKEVRYYPLGLKDLTSPVSDHAQLLESFEKVLHEVVASDARTLVIDSASRLWRSVRVVKTEEAQAESVRSKKNRADYELANDYFEQIVQVARQNRAMNIVLVHRHREIFATIDGKLTATGEIESRDYRGTENLVQIMVRTGTAEFTDFKTKTKVRDFAHVIEHCRFDTTLEGVAIRRLDYDKLVERIFHTEGVTDGG